MYTYIKLVHIEKRLFFKGAFKPNERILFLPPLRQNSLRANAFVERALYDLSGVEFSGSTFFLVWFKRWFKVYR